MFMEDLYRLWRMCIIYGGCVSFMEDVYHLWGMYIVYGGCVGM